MYANILDNTFISDNPYYFNNNKNNKSPKTPDSTDKGFSFFRRKSTKTNNTCISEKVQCSKPINSATLSENANVSLGSPRGTFGLLGTPSQVFDFKNGNNLIYRRSDINNKYRERIGSYNESCKNYNFQSDSRDNDVFLKINGSNTLPTNSNGNRRHSIGNITYKQRHSSLSDEVPDMIAPKPPNYVPNKPNTKCRFNDSKDCYNENANMDDILILTVKNSERAFSWAGFLRTRFDKITKQRGRKPFNFLHLKIDDGYFSTDLVKKCQATALQILIFCPGILLLPQQHLINQFESILNHDKVLVLLLDIKEEKLFETHKLALPHYELWKKCYIHQNDQSAIGNILGVATDILGRALCHRPPCIEFDDSSHKISSKAFTVIPKKVRISQNKILVMLSEPVTDNDYIRITIEKSGEAIEIKNFKQRNPFTLQINIPETCMEISTIVEIKIEKNGNNLGTRPLKCESRLREMELLLRKQDNPIEFMCTSLGISMMDRIMLDDHMSKCFQNNIPPNFKLFAGTLEKQLFSIREHRPEEFPTLLHFAAKYGLEQLCMQLLESPGGDIACQIKNFFKKTPAEIAEQEGYEKLAKSLKSFSQIHEFSTMYHYFKGITDSAHDSKVVIDTKNFDFSGTVKSSSLPKYLHKKINSNQKISKPNSEKLQLEYMEMSSGSENEKYESKPTANLNYVKVENDKGKILDLTNESLIRLNLNNNSNFNEISTELKINELPYFKSNEANNNINSSPSESTPSASSDKFSQECSNVLENWNISSQFEYLFQPSNIPINSKADYLLQPSNRPVELNIIFKKTDNNSENDTTSSLSDSHIKMIFDKKKSSKSLDVQNSNCSTLKRSFSDASSNKGNVDDELAEIMNDFKNNVLSIKDVEQLVEKWKNRNDVKQSFLEKQEQIEKLREEYERIQKKVKDKMKKRPTPFDRVKKLFSRSKSYEKKFDPSNLNYFHNKQEDLDETTLSVRSSRSSYRRPISSLSTQSVSSTSSSGCMSTRSASSGGSLGDSGTHSDHEDRNRSQIFSSNCHVGSPGSLIENYLIPPTPRPISTSRVTSMENVDNCNTTTNLCAKNGPSSSTVNKDVSEHYILFPSNIPVFQENQTNSLNTILETKEIVNTHGDISIPMKLKFFQEKNIVYGKLSKSNSKDKGVGLKSQRLFEPKEKEQIQPSKTSIPFDVKKEMNEVYQNINRLTKEKAKSCSKNAVDFPTDVNDINVIDKDSLDNHLIYNNNDNGGNNITENEDHNYINL